MKRQKRPDFEEFLEEQFGDLDEPPKSTREELGGLLISYFLESDHGGWEGFSSRDRSAIDRMLADMVLYYQQAVQDNSDYFKEDFYTGVVLYPGSKGKDRKLYHRG